jgi:PAS domain S-box-containing protein
MKVLESRTKSGEPLRISWVNRPIFNDDDELTEIFCAGIDVTKQWKVEQELIESEEKFKCLASASFEAIVIHESGIIIEANDNFFKLVGAEKEKVVGTNILDYTSPAIRAMANSYIRSKEVANYEAVLIRFDDDVEVPVEINSRPIRYQDKDLRVAAVRDISTYKETQKQLREYGEEMERLAQARAEQLLHADRLATLGTLAAGVAHEINNPVSFISGNVQILEKFWEILSPHLGDIVSSSNLDFDIDKIVVEMPRILSDMKFGVDRINGIVSGLRSFSHKDGEIAKSPCDICKSIRHSLMLCRNAIKYGIELEENFPKSATINAISQQLEQVFVNLITNAAHALEGKGKISITLIENDDNMIIRFEDSGPGIPEGARKKVWDAFYTTKQAGTGTGLGLSICKEIVDYHNGTIEVTSSESLGGACFVITLPK